MMLEKTIHALHASYKTVKPGGRAPKSKPNLALALFLLYSVFKDEKVQIKTPIRATR